MTLTVGESVVSSYGVCKDLILEVFGCEVLKTYNCVTRAAISSVNMRLVVLYILTVNKQCGEVTADNRLV